MLLQLCFFYFCHSSKKPSVGATQQRAQRRNLPCKPKEFRACDAILAISRRSQARAQRNNALNAATFPVNLKRSRQYYNPLTQEQRRRSAPSAPPHLAPPRAAPRPELLRCCLELLSLLLFSGFLLLFSKSLLLFSIFLLLFSKKIENSKDSC